MSRPSLSASVRRTLPPCGALTLALVFACESSASAPPQGPLDAPPRAAPRASLGGAWSELLRLAEERHGAFGARAAAFLAQHAPERDAALDVELLMENLTLALEARARFPWAAAVPEDVFLNDVLPYAVLDETRERWRPKLLEVAAPLVAGAETLEEAAQALNRGLFDAVNVHYDTGRKQPNQSPFESIAQTRATCTGLTILLVDACRAVGVPARAAGVASWRDKRGNHTWAEVFDGERWRFTGADEFDAAGLDRGWFIGDAAEAVAGNARYAVWASSWRSTGAHFPLAWSRDDRSVPGVDVTERYARSASAGARALASRNIRVWNALGGERVATEVIVRAADGSELARDTSRAGRADLNDMPAFTLPPGAYTLELARDGQRRFVALDATDARTVTLDLAWDTASTAEPEWTAAGLSRTDARALVAELWAARSASLATELAAELEAKAFVVGEHTLKTLEKRFGDAPEGERSLWLSMHGGGGAPREVNDRQWANQIRLYEPAEGFYVAPRAPTDTWNLWHQDHIDPLFQRVIEAYVALRGVDPDRVYLMGYSAGGDGVYQLAPRMADRFAAAAMMAGHPNETQPLGLRNLPFMLFMGGNDSAYQRNEVAATWGARLAELAAADAGAYPHKVTIYPDKGHWMGGADKEALPWMAAYRRNPWPRRVVWLQDDVVHTRFYWLAVPREEAVAGRLVRASVDGQVITLDAPETKALTLRLDDELVDLDQPVVVRFADAEVFRGKVPRTREAIEQSLAERADPRSAATALLPITR
jgi:transglutaminase-like putative cysteine protease/predicted esterase